MASDLEKAKKRLRQYLNPIIRGKNTDAILEALATASAHLINNVEAVNDMLYITTASGKYLDQRMSDKGIIRPDNVGLSDEVFREIGIEVSNRKQVRDLIQKILEIMYGEEFTKAFHKSTELEPYALKDGDSLILQFDDGEPVEVVFSTSQFQNINAATSQEVSDTIVKSLRNLGSTGTAFSRDDGLGGFVTIMSGTNGPSSSVRVLGGRAQNKLKFPDIQPTTAEVTTQWSIEVQPSGSLRAKWSGGPNPSVGILKVGDYVNIYGSAFSLQNQGTFTITEVQGGTLGNAYFEYDNIDGVTETTLQGDLEGMLFFNPKRSLIISQKMFATSYQTETRLLEVFMPATTRVVRRERIGAAHLHDSGASTVDDLGPYIYDDSKGYIIGQEECTNLDKIDSSTERVINVDDASSIPDQEGHLVFGFGTSKEEGPVPYIARPSSNTLLIDPSYQFKNTHEIGTNISLITQNSAYNVTKNGTDVPFYATDMVSGRIYAEDLIKFVRATGIVLNIIILYPNDVGLGKWGDYRYSERYYVWGEDVTKELFDKTKINKRI